MLFLSPLSLLRTWMMQYLLDAVLAPIVQDSSVLLRPSRPGRGPSPEDHISLEGLPLVNPLQTLLKPFERPEYLPYLYTPAQIQLCTRQQYA